MTALKPAGVWTVLRPTVGKMPNSQKKILLLLLVLAALGAALKLRTRTSASSPNGDSHPTAAEALPVRPSSSPSQTLSAEVPAPMGSSSAGASLPLLGPFLPQIGRCLGIRNSLNESAEMSLSALTSSLQNELGPLMENRLDWKNIHLTLPQGEKRRLRLEVEALSEESSGLRLKYYGVDKEDLPVPLPLPPEQSLNPTDTFIASLEGEGQVTLREEAHRGLYSQGSEIFYVERNGALSEFEISHQGKSVKCQDLQTSEALCQCF